ncbi:hypothetical protein FQA39_LY07722 [Lamprigera yunnana]|nr:hypothetical protein FQA39_LY07722 [Lamprigera yunnana]
MLAPQGPAEPNDNLPLNSDKTSTPTQVASNMQQSTDQAQQGAVGGASRIKEYYQSVTPDNRLPNVVGLPGQSLTATNNPSLSPLRQPTTQQRITESGTSTSQLTNFPSTSPASKQSQFNEVSKRLAPSPSAFGLQQSSVPGTNQISTYFNPNDTFNRFHVSKRCKSLYDLAKVLLAIWSQHRQP